MGFIPIFLGVCVFFFFDLAFQFGLRDQGMGTRRCFAAGKNAARSEAGWFAAGVLAD